MSDEKTSPLSPFVNSVKRGSVTTIAVHSWGEVNGVEGGLGPRWTRGGGHEVTGKWVNPRPVFFWSSSIRIEASALVKVGVNSSPASVHRVWRYEAWAAVMAWLWRAMERYWHGATTGTDNWDLAPYQ